MSQGEAAHHLSHGKWCVELVKVGAVQVHGIELDHVVDVGVGLVDDTRSVGADGEVRKDGSSGDERRVELLNVGPVQVHGIELDHCRRRLGRRRAFRPG